MTTYHLTLVDPYSVLHPVDGGNWNPGAPLLMLAQGDSWFSIGANPPFLTTNLLIEMRLPVQSCVANCAHPGDTIAHMVEWRQNPQFVALISGSLAYTWQALLMSAGGNDVIDAASVPPVAVDGTWIPPNLRLLLAESEWMPNSGPSRYVSTEGWAFFELHMKLQYEALFALLQGDESKNRDVPIFFHLYDYPMPRNAPASHFPLKGPGLQKAISACSIPQGEWFAVAKLLIDKHAAFVYSMQLLFPSMRIIDTRNILTPAVPGTTGASNDWLNEIHPTREGYNKLATVYAGAVSRELAL